MRKIYIAGKITGCPDYKENFKKAEEFIKNKEECVVLNPTILPLGLEHHEYMKMCYPMIDVSDTVIFLPNWVESKGAKMESDYAKENGKNCIYNYFEDCDLGGF